MFWVLQEFTGDRLRQDEQGLSAEAQDMADVNMDPGKENTRIDSS